MNVVYRDESGQEISREQAAANPGGSRQEEWATAAACISPQFRNDLTPGCSPGPYAIVEQCLDGSQALNPWWMRSRTGTGPWSDWSMRTGYRCPQESQLETLIRQAWASMPIAPNVISVQPDTGWVLTTVPTIVYVDRGPRTLSTTLAGTPVILRARPSAYTWTWGDGATSVTTSPGAPYPHHTVSHTYLHREGRVTIRLTTSWRGSYSLNGGDTWHSAPGTAHTTSTPVTVEVHNPHSHKVDCDTLDTCLTP